jgi:hypothetical protein
MAAATSFLWVKLMQSRLQGRPQWELKMPCWKCVEGERAPKMLSYNDKVENGGGENCSLWTAGKICSSGALDECLSNRVASRSDPAVWVA